MKHLGNCTPTEFLKQAMAMRQPLKEWLERTGIPAIRARKPENLEEMDADQRREAMIEQARRNMPDIIQAALEKDYEGSVALLCMATFTEPKDFDTHTIAEYMAAINAVLSNEGVKGFFTLYL